MKIYDFAIVFVLAVIYLLQTHQVNSASMSTDDEPQVYIISPENGDEVTSPFTVKFGSKSVDIVAAGVEMKNSGHHHLLVNQNSLPDMNLPIPADSNHLHFGGGQTETVLTLEPGVHSLQLLLGDFAHVPHVPPIISEKIIITVK
ncbi:MAG: rod shape-determining protein RodA [Gammaproteobacteria bacterium]|nr:rod shape-determining protein RodA [Gammaproteobacteria bacterium]|tara:strand:- start:117 stop:551 length:435 start_codon:yes stop_codon:yes gene_type:complete